MRYNAEGCKSMIGGGELMSCWRGEINGFSNWKKRKRMQREYERETEQITIKYVFLKDNLKSILKYN